MSDFPAGTDAQTVANAVAAMQVAGQGVTASGAVVYGQHNTPPLTRVYLDGELVGRVVAACPDEGWIVQAERDDAGVYRPRRRRGTVEVQIP